MKKENKKQYCPRKLDEFFLLNIPYPYQYVNNICHHQLLYQQFFDNRFDAFDIEPEHIFDLTMLRARAKDQKCTLRRGHPILGECSDLAFVEVNTGEWKKSCNICATAILGLNEISQMILHPDIRNLRD